MIRIIPDRLAALDSIVLAKGGHTSPEEGMCAAEAAAWIAGERFSDEPRCVSSVITVFLRTWNDGLSDTGRQRLKRFVPLIVGTHTTDEDEQRRAYLLAASALAAADVADADLLQDSAEDLLERMVAVGRKPVELRA